MNNGSNVHCWQEFLCIGFRLLVRARFWLRLLLISLSNAAHAHYFNFFNLLNAWSLTFSSTHTHPQTFRFNVLLITASQSFFVLSTARYRKRNSLTFGSSTQRVLSTHIHVRHYLCVCMCGTLYPRMSVFSFLLAISKDLLLRRIRSDALFEAPPHRLTDALPSFYASFMLRSIFRFSATLTYLNTGIYDFVYDMNMFR